MYSMHERFPLIVFCGKGGVGKTTLSLSYGLWNANRGLKTVVVTSHPLGEMAVSVSLQGIKEQYPQAAASLFLVHIDPREILANKVRQQIPSEFLARRVLSHSLYQNLIEVAPGLKEIAFLARLRQLAERNTQEGEVFDQLVWDAPATGHFLQTLKVSKNFEEYMSGPFSVLGRDLRRFFSDPANLRLIPVTTLEEMSVDETIELCSDLRNQLNMQPSDLICNLSSPMLGVPEKEIEDMYERLAAKSDDPGRLRFIWDRHLQEAELFRKLRSAVTGVFHEIPRIPEWNCDLDLLMTLGKKLGASLGDTPQ